MADAINIDRDMIKAMAASGCIGIKFGVESGSNRILKNIGKPLSLDKVNSLVKICKDYGVKSHATFIFGLLDEKKQDLHATVSYIKKLRADSIQVSVATPYPGTKFYEIIKKRGGIINDSYKYYDGKIFDNIYFVKLKRKAIFGWFIRKWCSPWLFLNNVTIFYRTLRGLGTKFFISKLKATVLDEINNN